MVKEKKIEIEQEVAEIGPSDKAVSGNEVSENTEDANSYKENLATPSSQNWYILQCYTGHERRIQEKLEKFVQDNKLQEKITRILVPEEEIIEIKNNKRIEKTTKIFPGYIFIQMDFDEALYYDIRRIVGNARFIGTKNQPSPVKEDEILKILRKIGDKTKKIDVDFEIGELIKVISGPFRGYMGPINEINGERGKVKVLISIFGRETPVELEFDQVEKSIE